MVVMLFSIQQGVTVTLHGSDAVQQGVTVALHGSDAVQHSAGCYSYITW